MRAPDYVAFETAPTLSEAVRQSVAYLEDTVIRDGHPAHVGRGGQMIRRWMALHPNEVAVDFAGFVDPHAIARDPIAFFGKAGCARGRIEAITMAGGGTIVVLETDTGAPVAIALLRGNPKVQSGTQACGCGVIAGKLRVQGARAHGAVLVGDIGSLRAAGEGSQTCALQ